MANKILFNNKIKVRDSALPTENKGTADDFNEIKAVVNSHADDIDANASDIANKQDALVSGTNIKTINGESLLGGGDIEISIKIIQPDNGVERQFLYIWDGVLLIEDDKSFSDFVKPATEGLDEIFDFELI